MRFQNIAEIVDLDRYPLHRPESTTALDLLSEGRTALANNALFSLPGFVRPEATAFMAGELEMRLPWASRYESMNNAYGFEEEEWPEGHPRTVKSLFRYHQVLNYQISNDSPLRKVYCWEPLREFLRRLMGYETFHRSECPHLALTSKIAGEGDTDGWHFDGIDVVFSVLLRAPEQGGQFEYVPNIRTELDQSYDDVAAVLAGNRELVRVATLAVGDLNVFQGDQTLHRVSPVVGNGRRIVGLFSYDREPGTNFGENYISQLRHRTPPCVPITLATD
jgi:hypothetical protein